MPEWSRSQVATYALLTFIVVFAGSRALAHDRAGTPVSAAEERAPGRGAALASGASGAPTDGASAGNAVAVTGAAAVVHVAGAVRRPGVYRLRSGDRIVDAVRRAGGARRGADLDQVNLAARVTDGQQILVPRSAPVGAAGGVATPAAGATAAPDAPINLNTATLEQLDTLDGVGPATAQKILDYRTAHSGFRTVDELAQVPGIGPKRLATLKPKVRV